jgi:hypothetical protein
VARAFELDDGGIRGCAGMGYDISAMPLRVECSEPQWLWTHPTVRWCGAPRRLWRVISRRNGTHAVPTAAELFFRVI